MNIQLFYWDGCPSYQRALDNLKEALRLEALTDPIEIVLVTTEADAHAKRLIGSPTVRVNSEDLEGTDAEARGFTLGCRVYRDAGHTSGWPSVVQIRAALQRARNTPGEGARP